MDDSVTLSILQSILTSALTGGLFYWMQRKHKIIDDFTIEKNKSLVARMVTNETELFEILNHVRSQYYLDEASLVNYSNQIMQKRMENYLYISDGVSKISREFTDYLLAVSQDLTTRKPVEEKRFIKNFKSEFKKSV